MYRCYLLVQISSNQALEPPRLLPSVRLTPQPYAGRYWSRQSLQAAPFNRSIWVVGACCASLTGFAGDDRFQRLVSQVRYQWQRFRIVANGCEGRLS